MFYAFQRFCNAFRALTLSVAALHFFLLCPEVLSRQSRKKGDVFLGLFPGQRCARPGLLSFVPLGLGVRCFGASALLRTLLRSTSRRPGTFPKRDRLNNPTATRPKPHQACTFTFAVMGRVLRSSFSTAYSDRWITGTQLV